MVIWKGCNTARYDLRARTKHWNRLVPSDRNIGSGICASCVAYESLSRRIIPRWSEKVWQAPKLAPNRWHRKGGENKYFTGYDIEIVIKRALCMHCMRIRRCSSVSAVTGDLNPHISLCLAYFLENECGIRNHAVDFRQRLRIKEHNVSVSFYSVFTGSTLLVSSFF